ncbi:glycosyltransferase [Oceaniglobus roseus]|uniref:glycosyltransferase n=1 Tax=Oceaniglobus roseus TaxID=1737570 RepID=UPI000C7F43D5|nr:glycosyltransferase [Kandeliimicrobium roseum]
MTTPRPARRRCAFGSGAGWPVVVTIPARNEADRIVACLDAAALALRGRGGLVVAVNGSQDDTFERARRWFEATGAAGVLLDDHGGVAGGVGAARRRAVEAGLARLAPAAVVMTTDADSTVFPDWVDANLDALRQADLVCGTVLPDPAEFARLPTIIAGRGAIEGEYTALTIALRTLVDPVPHDPAPTHNSEPGASLAFRMALYDDVGGMPAIPEGEDRTFAARADLRGWRLRHSAEARVSTSCRLRGRTPGGMARALSARITEADPAVDAGLETAAATLHRARLRRHLRELQVDPDASAAALAQARNALTALPRRRLRLSDLHRELPELAAAVQALRPAEGRLTA